MPIVRDVLRSGLVWTGFAGAALVAFPPMLLGYPLVLVDPERALSDWWFRTLGRALMTINPRWSVTVDGKERLATGGPFVLVVNHQSLTDLMAMCFLDHPTKYLGKESVFKVPLLGWAMRIAGEVPVRRGERDSGAQAVERLRDWLGRGVSVAIFPEGTRSEDGSIGPFRLGAFRLAIETERPIVPVVISGAAHLLPKGSWIFQEHAEVGLRVLLPVSTAGLSRDDAQTLAEKVRAQMIAESSP
jgi:1-acyl-sn-glycerol-3-phosphate acyltransferase